MENFSEPEGAFNSIEDNLLRMLPDYAMPRYEELSIRARGSEGTSFRNVTF